MANFVPNWGPAQNEMVARPLTSVDAMQANINVPYEQVGRVIQAYEPFLGAGEFEYVYVSTTVLASQVVEFDNVVDPTFSTGCIFAAVVPWAGTANSGKPLGVALVGAAAGNFTWVQLSGNAVVNTSGTIAPGNAGNWVTPGKLQAAAVAGKQALNVVAATAAAATIGTGSSALALAANTAIYALNFPVAQGNIT